MRLFFTLAVFCSCSSICFSQETLKKKNSKIKLLRWSTEACDNTYDPYRLQNRITRLELKEGITSMTVNFSDNCCADFKPTIEFKGNKLKILPYKEYFGEYCGCNCCFSINFEIQGIKSKDFETYFQNQKIAVSDDYYKAIEPTYVLHEGNKINQINKYGFKEGIWIEFYDDGTQKSIAKYPEHSLYYEPDDEWSKGYFESGKLSFYSRNDTIESWFQDGELKSQIIKYTVKDTTYKRRFEKYENKQLKEKSLERHYPVIFKSQFDPTYKGEGSVFDYVYKEKYYSSGQQKYLQMHDTTYEWFESGQFQRKEYDSGQIEYGEQGQVIQKVFHWNKPGVKGWGDLNYSLYIDYYENGDLEEIHFVRDEPSKDEESLAPGVHYFWKWDKAGKIIESPEIWMEDYPWKNINEVKLLLVKYKLH
jgi:hypothetical protein